MNKPWTKFYPPEAKGFDLANMGPQTFAQLLDYAAETHGDKPALTTMLPTGAEATMSFREMRETAEAFAAYLREDCGLAAGATVAIMTPNCIGFAIASMGASKAGCVCTNVNPLYTAPELAHQLSHSKAEVLVISDLFGDKVDEIIASTGVKHVVTLSLLEGFSPIKRTLLNFVLKRVRKVIPSMKTPAITLKAALAKGRAHKADVARYTANVSPQDTALYQYTSGTTGRSKGAELSHRAVLANAYQAELMTMSLKTDKDDTTLIVLPLYHITAFTLIFIAGLRTGMHGVLIPSPRPLSNLKPAFEKHSITWLIGINTLYAALLVEEWFSKDLIPDLRFSASGGAAQTTGVARHFEEVTGVPIRQGYGMTECAGLLTTNPPFDNRLGLVGIPIPGMEVRIVDEAGNEVPPGTAGEIIARGPTLMTGYLDNPEATAETIRDGWLHSGDIGEMDADGFVHIVDRKKDMILVSGFNVAPNEIEDTISQLDEVAQVGVVGVPDDKTGEAPAAFVVRADESLTKEQVIEACRKGLTNYKVPKRIEFVDDVPTTPTGKVLRKDLRARHLG